MKIIDDGLGTMTHYARGQMPFITGYHPNGYYWQHINGQPVGAFSSRKAAERDERNPKHKPKR